MNFQKSPILVIVFIFTYSISYSQNSVTAQIKDSILRLLQPASLPFDVKSKESYQSGNATVQEISFRVNAEHKASAWLTSPQKEDKKSPLLIFIHWGGGNKDEFLKEAITFTSKGFICMSLDAPWHWNTYDTTKDFLLNYPSNIQLSVLSVKRAIDLAISQYNADNKKVFYIGHSYGATLGGLLAAAEPRIKAMILIAGLPNISASMITDARGFWQNDKANRKTLFDQVTHRLSLMEPEDYINLSKAKVYHQYGTEDEIVSPDDTQRYIKASKNLVTAKGYKTDHLLDSEAAVGDRIKWMCEKAGLVR